MKWRHKMKKKMLVKNARVVTPAGIIENGRVLVENGIITGVGGLPGIEAEMEIDAENSYLIPGFVDLHCDCIEKEIEQRPGSYFPANISIIETDKKAVSSGITTTFYSLSFAGVEIGLRSNAKAKEIVSEIIRLKSTLIADSRIHARFEITATEAVPLLEELINSGYVDMLSLMDHTPGQGQFKTEKDYKNYYGKTYKKDESMMEQTIKIKKERKENEAPANIEKIIKLCAGGNIIMASHDDDSDEKIRFLAERKIPICEFPVNMSTAKKAREEGLDVILGAPNIIKGSSHSNNLSALDAIKAGYGNIICSDYMAASMIYAVFKIAGAGILALHEAVNMTSLNPANAAGLGKTKGSIEKGKDADMMLVDGSFEVPVIESVFVAGKEAYRRMAAAKSMKAERPVHENAGYYY
jgi:alpha-D-ribose 1-methylphosphonate 5-triphosphate diphosphatase